MTTNKKANTAVFTHNKVDASCVIEVRADGLILIDFLAKGSSQIKRGGKVVGYNKRNPERSALVKHVLEALSDDGCTFVASSCRGQVSHITTLEGAQSANSSAGNFRWSLFVRMPRQGRSSWRMTARQLAEKLGLVANEKHRAVRTTWPTLVASLTVALTAILAA